MAVPGATQSRPSPVTIVFMTMYFVGMRGEPTSEQWPALHSRGAQSYAYSWDSEGRGFIERTYLRVDADSEVDAKDRVADALGVDADELAIYREDEGWRWRPLPPP